MASNEHPPVHPSNSTASHLSISVQELLDLRLVARGSLKPSAIIRNGKVLALHTGELLERDVIISGRHIAAITPWGHFPRAELEIDALGKYISPGFIDAHIHIEYTKLVPGELARLSVPRGTTCVLADANCIANVLGGDGMDFMGTTSTPLRIFRQVSHQVPMSPPEIELGGTSVSTSEICERVSRTEAATLGESNPFSLDLASAQKQASALHAERLRLGMMLTVMSGSMNSNIPSVFSNFELYKDGINHISFCADDKLCEDLDASGHIDHHVREAIRLGVPVLQAYRMATLNPAAYYRLDHILGSVTPAKVADLLILDNLEEARPEIVIVNGQIAARNKKVLFTNKDPIPDFTLNTVHISPHFFEPSAFHVFPRVGQTSAWVQAMEMYDGYFKRAFHANLPASSAQPGELLPDISRDILKVVVIDRHHHTRNRGIGFVRGFGLRRGAIACTTNCETQNLVVIGTSDSEIAAAVRAISVLGGGFVAVCAGELLGAVKLDIAGCMSSAPWEDVRDDSLALDEKVSKVLGCTMRAPYLIASFVGLAAVPDLGLTEKGLITGGGLELMDVVLDAEEDGTGGNTERALPARAQSSVKVCCRCPSHAHDVHRLMETAATLS
ncbi:hypothetical protein SLS57_000222 [Botryosphaeria dothidea]